MEQFIFECNRGKTITKVMVEYEQLMDDEGIIALAFGEHDFKLKINSNNTINISIIESNWLDVEQQRDFGVDEVRKLIHKYRVEMGIPGNCNEEDCNTWLNKVL